MRNLITAAVVFLWTLAARTLDRPNYEELALGAGYHAWESPELKPDLQAPLLEKLQN